MEDVDNKIIPIGCVLTMVGTGSKMNGGAVISNHEQKLKTGHVFGDNVFPKFSILNPKFTYTLPKYQMTAGNLRHLEPYNRAVFFGRGRQHLRLYYGGLAEVAYPFLENCRKKPEDYEAQSKILCGSQHGR